MAAQTPLLPSLFALLPPNLYTEITSHLSLQSLHAEPYTIVDSIYQSTSSVIPGQHRIIRLRARRSSSNLDPKRKGKGKEKDKGLGEEEEEREGKWDYKLAYLSAPLSGREYAEMNVKASVGVDVAGLSTREEIEDFIVALGFTQSHTYTRSGIMFHLPLPHPNMTLQLTITRILGSNGDGKVEEGEGKKDRSGESWFVQLQPSRPVMAVAGRGELALADVMGMMREMAGRLDGLEWSNGR